MQGQKSLLGLEQRNDRIGYRFYRGHFGSCIENRCRETRRDTKTREEAAAIVQVIGTAGQGGSSGSKANGISGRTTRTTGLWSSSQGLVLKGSDLSVLSLGPPCPAPLP